MVIQKFGSKFNLFLYLAFNAYYRKFKKILTNICRTKWKKSLITLPKLSILRFLKQGRKLQSGFLTSSSFNKIT